MKQPKIIPAILCGGGGKRLWPVSRGQYPKQFLKLAGDRSLLEQTLLRVKDPERFGPPIVIANEDYRFIVGEQLAEVGMTAQAILLEPAARNTAPALAAAAMLIAETAPDAMMLVLPSDHLIADWGAFNASIDMAMAVARQERLVTFGMKPTAPETGYGYIEAGAGVEGVPGACAIASFVEKPDLATARDYLASGRYLWNSGMFLFPVALLIEELSRFEPEVVAGVRAALDERGLDKDFTRLGAAFANAKSISIDYAVMERTNRAAVVPGEMRWTDVGSWNALWETADKDADGNAVQGDAVLVDTSGSYVRTSGPLVTTLGVSDLVVVVTDDAVLITPRDKSQDVRKIVERLEQLGRSEAESPRLVYRPWGHYQSVQDGERYQVKRIVVKPGAQLSLQKHFHRAEHWVVVNGTAIVTRDGEDMLLRENESTYLPLGCVHRLTNPGKIPLTLIEVQSGAYLGEDDIVRFEDNYNRV